MGHQEAVDEFLPILNEIKKANAAAITWASIEPLIERVRLRLSTYNTVPIDWAVIGFESGLKARDGDIAWIRALLEECTECGVAKFVKQLGRHPYDGLSIVTDKRKYLKLKDATHGGDPSEWAVDLRVREYPRAA